MDAPANHEPLWSILNSWFERKYRSNSKGHLLVIGRELICISRKCKKKKIFTSQQHPSWARSRNLNTSGAREDEGSYCADQKHLESALCQCALHGTCTIIFFILFHILLRSRDTWKLVCLDRDRWGSSQKTRFTRVEAASWLPPDGWNSSCWQAGKDWAAVLG